MVALLLDFELFSERKDSVPCTEVDGANMARSYFEEINLSVDWDKDRTQLMWDSIALHATPSFALHKEPEVLFAHIGIMADFWGPIFFSGGVITVDECKEIIGAFPCLGFRDQLIQVIRGLCTLKPETTYDNFVGEYGSEYGHRRQGYWQGRV
jgi:hypothetical protein